MKECEFLTIPQLWSGYDAAELPLDVEPIDEIVHNNSLVEKRFFFTSEQASDGPLRVSCSVFFKTGIDYDKAVVYAGDLFTGADFGLVQKMAEKLMVVSVDLSGQSDDVVGATKYPDSLSYGVPDVNSQHFKTAYPSAKHTSWYLWAKILRRAAEFVKQNLSITTIALLGENTASTAAYMAGLDDNYTGVATIFGAGYISYRGVFKYAANIPLVMDEAMESFFAGVEAQSYARYYRKPVLMVLATNSEIADFYRAQDLFELFDTTKTMLVCPMLKDSITISAANNLLIWLENTLSGNTDKIRRNPECEIVVSSDQYYFTLKTDDVKDLEKVVVYYTTTDALPKYSEWRAIKVDELKSGEYSVLLAGGESAVFLAAFANIYYKDGTFVSSAMPVVRSKAVEQKKDLGPRRRLIYPSPSGVAFVPYNKDGIIVDDKAMYLKEGAYGIRGIAAKNGMLLNYTISSSDIESEIAFISMDVYNVKEPREINITLSRFVVDVDGEIIISDEYYTKHTVCVDKEWQKLRFEPKEFRCVSGEKMQLNDFRGVKLMLIENAVEVLFNNVLLV